MLGFVDFGADFRDFMSHFEGFQAIFQGFYVRFQGSQDFESDLKVFKPNF